MVTGTSRAVGGKLTFEKVVTNILIGLMTTIVTALIRGYVLSLIWAWFVVPTFHAPALSIPVSLGIALLVGYLTASIKELRDGLRDADQSGKSYRQRALSDFSLTLIIALTTVLAAAIYHAFM